MSERRRCAKLMAATYAAWIASYQVVGTYASRLPAADLTTAWDRAIPLVPEAVWAYELCYVMPIALLFVVRDWARFDRALASMTLASAVAFVTYVSFPVAFARPSLGTSLSERLLALEYAAEFTPGANNMPSLHVALSWIMGRAMFGQRGRAADAVVLVVVLAITVSTVLVKQHLVADVATGAVLAAASWALTERVTRARDAAGAAHP